MDAIRRVPTDRPDLYAFEVLGKITKPDIERMAETLQRAFDAPGEIDILLTMPGYDGIEIGAALDAKAVSAQARSARHVRRYAVVGAPAWASTMIDLLSPVSPVEARTFSAEEEADAWAWVGGAPARA